MLRNLGVQDPPEWFNDPSWAVPAMVIIGLWGVLGSGAIIYLAGLQNISPAMYEAAMIDGAGAWRRFWSITIPLLTPTLFFMLLDLDHRRVPGVRHGVHDRPWAQRRLAALLPHLSLAGRLP